MLADLCMNMSFISCLRICTLHRHERSKGEDGLRINYWYLIRPDGGEDLAVIGREIKGSGGHYNYNSVRSPILQILETAFEPGRSTWDCMLL